MTEQQLTQQSLQARLAAVGVDTSDAARQRSRALLEQIGEVSDSQHEEGLRWLAEHNL